MRWFGPSWGAPINEIREMPVPVGATCSGYGCAQYIESGDRGVALPWVAGTKDMAEGPETIRIEGEHWLHIAFHLSCYLESVLGPGDLLDAAIDSVKQA